MSPSEKIGLSPLAVRTLELTEPWPSLEVTPYGGVRLFLMWSGRPVGSVDVSAPAGTLAPDDLREAVIERCAAEPLRAILRQALPGDPADAPRSLPTDVSVSIVVATYDRPHDLRNCLLHLTDQAPARRLELIVVDNHPASGLTAPVVAEFPRARLVEEPRRGLAYARNAGFVAARGDIAVCTDDDVSVPSRWLETLIAPFVDPDVMAVTGNILPSELETPAQRAFELYGALGRGFRRRVVDGAWFHGWHDAVPTWKLGATANAAFRSSIFGRPEIGLMDEALGPGMPSGVGEDTYLFYRILKAGHRVVYEPAAYVWHRHRRGMGDLRRQVYCYSKGHVAYHLTTLIRDHDMRALRRLGLTLPLWHARQVLRWARSAVAGRNAYPLSMVLLEVAGFLAGPAGLWRSRRRVRRDGRSGPYAVSARGAATSSLPAAHREPCRG